MVDDIYKLRPELLDKSDAELDRLKAEIELAQAEKRRLADAKRAAEIAAEAGRHVDAVIESAKWLHDHGLLSQRLTDALSRSDGQFNPATFVRAPRGDDVPRARSEKKEGPRRFRRRRDPVTGELVPSKAARVDGVG
jgi:hypothetical protein